MLKFLTHSEQYLCRKRSEVSMAIQITGSSIWPIISGGDQARSAFPLPLPPREAIGGGQKGHTGLGQKAISPYAKRVSENNKTCVFLERFDPPRQFQTLSQMAKFDRTTG